MAISELTRNIVVISLSLIFISAGIVFVAQVSEIKDVLPELPLAEENISVSVYPENSETGTQFLITAESLEFKENQDLTLEVISGEYRKRIKLYDDGEHQDALSGDGIFGGYFDSDGRFAGQYEITNGVNNLASFSISSPECEIVIGTANDKAINFAVLPYGYEDYNEFKARATKIVSDENALLNLEPFKSKKSDFSFTLISPQQDLECEKDCSDVDTIICCNNQAVKEEASQCHHDNIIVLLNENDYCGSASSYAKICAENYQSELILAHELGHSFAGLADEYVYENYEIGRVTAPNCAESCDKWSSLTDGCFEGCSYSNLFRPSRSSIMYDLTPEFNIVSQSHINSIISSHKETESAESPAPDKSYFVNIKVSQGILKINEIITKPIKPPTNSKTSIYKAEIIDQRGYVLSSNYLDIENIILPLPNSSDHPIPQEIEDSLILQYSPLAEKLIVKKDDIQIAQADLSALSDRCGDKICNTGENHVSCPIDCEINEDNFCESSICDKDCQSQENCITQEQKTNYTIIFLAVGFIALIIAFISIKQKYIKKK